MKISYREPTSPRYIYINPETNTVHLMMPIVGGTEIGTDNTCKSAFALKQFFGKNVNSDIEKNSALHELERYKSALVHDISMLSKDNVERQKKEERLVQIKQYIELFTRFQKHQDLAGLSEGYADYPPSIKSILKERDGAYFMLLRPEEPDGFTRAVNPVFSLMRSSTSGPALSPFQSALKKHLAKVKPSKIKTPQEKLNEAVVTEVGDAANFEKLLQVIAQKAKKMFGIDLQLNDPSGKKLSKEYIDAIMGFDDDTPGTTKEYVSAIINTCAANLSVNAGSSPFNGEKNPEKLSILTQFFLGETNIYCAANGLSKENFGMILESKPKEAESLAIKVKEALEKGDSVENVLFSYINAHHKSFGLKDPLTSVQMKEIANKFNAHYETVKEAPHFDEFFIMDDRKPGKFVTHQGAICVDFSELLKRVPGFKYDEKFASKVQQDKPKSISHRNDSVKGTVEIDESRLATYFPESMKHKDTIPRVAGLLLSDTDNGKKLFERLDDKIVKELLQHKSFPILKEQLVAQCNDEKVLTALNRRFPGVKDEATFVITDKMAKFLYSAAAQKFGPDVPGYSTEAELTKLLSNLGIKDASLTKSDTDGYVVTCGKKSKAALEETIRLNEGKIYLTPKMAASLYLEATRLLGKDSDAIKKMNALNNSGHPPRKLQEALRLLQLDVEDIGFPRGGVAGYIIKTNAEAVQNIENIHASQIQLAQASVAAQPVVAAPQPAVSAPQPTVSPPQPSQTEMESRLQILCQVLKQANDPQRGSWRRMDGCCLHAHVQFIPNHQDGTWEFGRSRHSGNLGIANSQVQIEFTQSGITILEKPS